MCLLDLFREDHRFVVFMLVRIRNFTGIDATLFFPAQERDHAQYFFLTHRRTERPHCSTQIFGNAGGDGDVNVAVCVAGIFEYATGKARPLGAVAAATVTEGAASSEHVLTGLDDLHVVGWNFHVLAVRFVLRGRRQRNTHDRGKKGNRRKLRECRIEFQT